MCHKTHYHPSCSSTHATAPGPIRTTVTVCHNYIAYLDLLFDNPSQDSSLLSPDKRPAVPSPLILASICEDCIDYTESAEFAGGEYDVCEYCADGMKAEDLAVWGNMMMSSWEMMCEDGKGVFGGKEVGVWDSYLEEQDENMGKPMGSKDGWKQTNGLEETEKKGKVGGKEFEFTMKLRPRKSDVQYKV